MVTARASDSYRRIYAVVSRIPRGRVATYGQVAALARLPRQARLVGYALNVLPSDTAVPWHRVVNAKGEVSVRADGLGHEELQAKLLKREGRAVHGGRRSRSHAFAGSRGDDHVAPGPRPGW